jgi:osomolarity two-component system, sensor histidine kinase SLN1
VLSGVEMVKQLRKLGRKEFIGMAFIYCSRLDSDVDHANLVGITGNALKEDQVEYMEAGLDRVLTKPVLERSLKERLKLALDRRKMAKGV